MRKNLHHLQEKNFFSTTTNSQNRPCLICLMSLYEMSADVVEFFHFSPTCLKFPTISNRKLKLDKIKSTYAQCIMEPKFRQNIKKYLISSNILIFYSYAIIKLSMQSTSLISHRPPPPSPRKLDRRKRINTCVDFTPCFSYVSKLIVFK